MAPRTGVALILLGVECLVMVSATTAVAPPALSPTALFGDHMVLQASARGAQLNGLAAAGARVTLTIDPPLKSGGTFSTAADSSGAWQIDKLAATMNEGPYTFTLSSLGTSFQAVDVWFGLVLLCTGQSNMELNFHPIYNNDSLIASATTPEIRMFKVPVPTGLHTTPLPPGTPLGGWSRNSSSNPDAATGGMNWTLTSPATITQFSAICYLTAREISKRVMCEMGACHMGLIQSCLGSTDVQSWMSEDMREQARQTCWAEDGMAPPSELPPSHSNAPSKAGGAATLLFNAMLAPIAGTLLGGVLWDQGENNAHYCSVHEYNCLFTTMVQTWRKLFPGTSLAGDTTWPIGWVQLGPYQCNGNVSTIRLSQTDALPASEGWFSNHSATRLPIPLSVVVPTYDLCSPQPGHEQTPGEVGYNCWIHARNKSEVARRLALQLLHVAPAANDNKPTAATDAGTTAKFSGPVVKAATLVPAGDGRSPRVILTLDHAVGLTLSPAQGCVQCCNQTSTPDSQTAIHVGYSRSIAVFEVANRRGIWLPAIGTVESVAANGTATVLVTPQGHAAVVSNDWLASVRYAMVDEPQCVLYSSASLPALPFQLPVPWQRP